MRISLAAGFNNSSYGAGFACAIVATLHLALAMVLEVYKRAKPFTVYLFFLLVLSLAGFVLAAVSAFGGWSSSSILLFYVGLTNQPTGQASGALAMLILGFLFGYFHFLAAALKGPFPLTIALSALAFVFTFIGTILGAGVRLLQGACGTAPSRARRRS